MVTSETADVSAHRIIRQETCSLASVRRVAAMLDQEPDRWREGDALPRGWQFILLGADTRRSEVRGDGFAGLGVPLPDLGLPRLLIGGRTVTFHRDIWIGSRLRRESRVANITCKETAGGPMAVVTVAHMLFATDANDPILSETQTYILLGDQPSERKPPTHPATTLPTMTKSVTPDDILLFQYSALGFNSHRIHLDRAYAREKEGFPDLVVNGGLTTLLLTELLRVDLDATPTSLRAKYVAPLFCGRPLTLGGERRDGGWLLQAFDEEGRLAVAVEANVEA